MRQSVATDQVASLSIPHHVYASTIPSRWGAGTRTLMLAMHWSNGLPEVLDLGYILRLPANLVPKHLGEGASWVYVDGQYSCHLLCSGPVACVPRGVWALHSCQTVEADRVCVYIKLYTDHNIFRFQLMLVSIFFNKRQEQLVLMHDR